MSPAPSSKWSPAQLLSRGRRTPSARPSGHDVDEVCRMVGMEAGQLRFLQVEFSEYLGEAGGAVKRASFDAGAVELLREIHQDVFVDGRSLADVHRRLSGGADGVEHAHVIAITSGKGGVGKTTVSINLAAAMVRAGLRTLLIDGDLGMGNVHVLTGRTADGSIADVLRGLSRLEDVIVEGPGGMDMICGASGVVGLANIDAAAIRELQGSLRRLGDRYDIVLVDTGAGISAQVVAFLGIADDMVLVTTPDVPAMLDGYGVMKVARESGIGIPVHVMVNQVEKPTESDDVFGRIEACAQRYLNDQPEFLGSLKRDRTVKAANQERQPVALASPRAGSVKIFDRMAARLNPRTREGVAPS